MTPHEYINQFSEYEKEQMRNNVLNFYWACRKARLDNEARKAGAESKKNKAGAIDKVG